jgi:hypothetical protein
MAIIKRGILGGFQNRIGNIVGSSWKGIAVMKSLPLSVSNPNTTAQQAQRSKFKGVVEYASALLSGCIKPLWDRFAQEESGYNAFIRANISNFNDDGDIVNVGNTVLAIGKLAPATNFTATANASTNVVTVSSKTRTAGSFDANTDQVYLVVVNNVTKEVLFSGQAGIWSDSTNTATCKEFGAGVNIIILLATRSADGTNVGGTKAVGVTSA